MGYFPQEFDLPILVSDIGSTTTKTVLLDRSSSGLEEIAYAQVPTTVESPYSDVTIGLYRAIAQLERISGVTLRKGDGTLSVPFYTTSSAGGGLQMIVTGYTQMNSCRIARAAAQRAGAVISDTFSVDGDRRRLEKIRAMSNLSPDLVLMAGGTDGGAVSGVVYMAHLLKIASPVPKYGSGSLPVLFCGNPKAARFVEETLGEGFKMICAPNVSPDNQQVNLRPAVDAVADMFMRHVMSRAPGYSKILPIVSTSVLPTPLAVSAILQEYAKLTGGEAALVDMGGATTDVFSTLGGGLQRTVSANIGMTYSMANTIVETGTDSVQRHLPPDLSNSVMGWGMSKCLFPESLPESRATATVENAIAVEGLRKAWKHHLQGVYESPRKRTRDYFRLRGPASYNRPLETLGGKRVSLADIKTLIGAGGVFAHSPPRRAAWMLAEAFRPPGITTLSVDTHFRSPHMGVLLSSSREEAVEHYSDSCIRGLCRVISPTKRLGRGRTFARISGAFGTATVRAGEFLYLDESGDALLELAGKPPGKGMEFSDDLPVLIDCREDDQPLPMDFETVPVRISGKADLPRREQTPQTMEAEAIELSLPLKGEISAEPGKKTTPGMLLGRVRELPPRRFYIEVTKARSCPPDLSTDQVMRHIQVKPGDRVAPGHEVFSIEIEHSAGSYRSVCHSQVSGMVTDVLKPGVVVLEERVEHDSLPHVVDVANEMHIPPKQMCSFLKVQEGDFVYKGQAIAMDRPVSYCVAPVPGFITGIDRGNGRVTIKYEMPPVEIRSPVFGQVVAVGQSRRVKLTCSGTRLDGVLGFGGNGWGSLCPLDGHINQNCLAYATESLTRKGLYRAFDRKPAGLLCPSIPPYLISEYLGYQPRLLMTGSEEVPIPLMVLNGIGSDRMDSAVAGLLQRSRGRHAALFPATCIRSGIKRPFLLIQNTASIESRETGD